MKKEMNNKRGSNLDDSALVDVLLNAASVLASNDTEVTLLTPAGAPRVTDEPVDSGARLTPANNVDGVSDGGGAARAVHDAALVGMHLASIEVDGDDTSVVDGSLDGRDAGANVADSGDLDLDLGSNILASALLGSVAVGRVEHHTLLGIGHGIRGAATIAAVAGSDTVDELLLREHRRSLLLGLGIGASHGGNGREGPARTARCLVADGRDPALVAGIPGGGKSSNLLSSGLSSNLVNLGKLDLAVELLREAVRDGGHAILSVVTKGVVLSSLLHVGVEDLITTSFLGVRLVGLAIGGLVGLPERIDLEGKSAGSSSEEGKGINSLHVGKQ